MRTRALGVDAAATAPRNARLGATALLLARPGLARRRARSARRAPRVDATKARGAGTERLSYWNDNQAGYSWWSVGSDQSVWGVPEDIYLALKRGYDAARIPVRGWEPDNNFVVDYYQPESWTGNDLRVWNATLYPSGARGFVEKLGNLSMVYYTNGFGDDTALDDLGHGPLVKGWCKEPHPNASAAFYADLYGGLVGGGANMQMLFTDFLVYRGPGMRKFDDVADDAEPEHLWLAGMTRGAQDAGAEVQYCMASAHHVLASLEFEGVTNARVNGDGGLDTVAIALPAVLAGALGVGWSKDNLRTADRCYVDPASCGAGGTDCDCASGVNQDQRIVGEFAMQLQQTVLAALSLGPVGLAAQLSAAPDDPSATITTNRTLAMATCDAGGTLLQPSYPLAPVERMLLQAGGFGDCTATRTSRTQRLRHRVYATYTMIATAAADGAARGAERGAGARPPGAATAVWWTVLGFAAGRAAGVRRPRSGSSRATSRRWSTRRARARAPRGRPRGRVHRRRARVRSAAADSCVWWAPDFVNQDGCANVARARVERLGHARSPDDPQAAARRAARRRGGGAAPRSARHAATASRMSCSRPCSRQGPRASRCSARRARSRRSRRTASRASCPGARSRSRCAESRASRSRCSSRRRRPKARATSTRAPPRPSRSATTEPRERRSRDGARARHACAKARASIGAQLRTMGAYM